MRKIILYPILVILWFSFSSTISFGQENSSIQITHNSNGLIKGYFSTTDDTNKESVVIIIHGQHFFKKLNTDKFFSFNSVPSGEYMITAIKDGKMTFIRINHENAQ